MIEAREQELEKIRDGQLKAAKRIKSTAETKRDAFDKYIRLFYDLRKIDVSFICSFLCYVIAQSIMIRSCFKVTIN